jgi:hypothetical protein
LEIPKEVIPGGVAIYTFATVLHAPPQKGSRIFKKKGQNTPPTYSYRVFLAREICTQIIYISAISNSARKCE